MIDNCIYCLSVVPRPGTPPLLSTFFIMDGLTNRTSARFVCSAPVPVDYLVLARGGGPVGSFRTAAGGALPWVLRDALPCFL